jgi:hypothetical protein
MRLAIVLAAHVALSACAPSRTTIRSQAGDPAYLAPPLQQSFVVAETALLDNRYDRLPWTAKSETIDGASCSARPSRWRAP